VQRKPLELLKFLACSRDLQADHASACTALWPDAEEFAARRSLEMATSRLRDMLGNTNWIRVSAGRTKLDSQFVWCDAQELWHVCSDAEHLARSGARDASVQETAESLLTLYRGTLLAGEEEAPWLLGAREKMRSAFVRAVRTMATKLQEEERPDVAIALLERAYSTEPLAEEVAQQLMRTHLAYGEPAEAMRVYRQLRQMLSVLLGIDPSPVSERLRESIVAKHPERSF
jgi:LuxR family transcriptional regulator, maltose regulon positive regulatory protein